VYLYKNILDNMAKTYAIFKVYDYKGGELSSSTNLTYKNFINELTELFDNLELDDLSERRDRKIKKVLDGDSVESASDIEYIKSEIKKFMDDEDFYSTYAGGDGFCGELTMYEVEDGRMTSVDIVSYIDDIAKVLLKRLK